MGKMNLKKFSIYEFTLDLDGETIDVIYKKDDENSSNSMVVAKSKNIEFEIPINLFTAIHEALNEIDPYGFVFSDFDKSEKEE